MAEDVLVNWWGMEGSAAVFRALAAIHVECGPCSFGGKRAVCYLLAREMCRGVAIMELI